MTVQEYAVKLRSNISKIIKGKDDKIDLVIMALLSGGHVRLFRQGIGNADTR